MLGAFHPLDIREASPRDMTLAQALQLTG